MRLAFRVDGPIVPKPRAKVGRTHQGRSVAYYPERSERSRRLTYPEYKESVQVAAIKELGPAWQQGDLEGVYRLTMTAHIGTGLGDCDNILGTVMDALQGIVWANDRQVTHSVHHHGQNPPARGGTGRLRCSGVGGMKVLVACEFSGIVRDAFIERGHDAISCDLLPTERPGPHIQGDVRPY